MPVARYYVQQALEAYGLVCLDNMGRSPYTISSKNLILEIVYYFIAFELQEIANRYFAEI